MAAPNGVAVPQDGMETDAGFMENGRWYGKFRRGRSMLPIDDEEQDKMDIFHKLFLVARRNMCHEVRLSPGNARILDLGTGTGIWAIDMADTYRDAEVVGMDLTMMQPAEIPKNLTFIQMDIESPWHGLREGTWDMIHMRMLYGSIQNWGAVYAKAFRHLRPRFGHIEHIEIDWRPHCDDGTLPENSYVQTWAEQLIAAMDEANKPIAVDSDATRGGLQAAGFVDITEKIIRVPFSGWSTDATEAEIGRWFNLGLSQGIHALTVAPLYRIKGKTNEEIMRLIDRVRTEVCLRKYHGYCLM